MAKDETEIAVVGAGPSGLIAAREAAKRGVEAIIFEEHEAVGVPCHCAGLLSLKGLAGIQVPPDDCFVQNKVRGARFFSPSKLSFPVEKDESTACVVNRARFDRFIADQAKEAGADIRLESKVESIRRLDGRILLIGGFGTVEAEIVIDAEGVTSRLIEEVGLEPLAAAHLLPALQYDLEDVDIDPDYVEIHVGREVAPHFFAWIIPLDESSVRVGLACKGSPFERLERFVADRFGKGSNPCRSSIRSGRIVPCGPIPRSFEDNFMAVGDVAGQVKPTTGGGVIWGSICAMFAGMVAAEAVEAQKPSKGFLINYETLWRSRLQKEIDLTLLARKIADRLSDRAVDKIFEIIIESNLHRDLSIEADMDFQAETVLKLAARKDVAKILLSAAKDLVFHFGQ